tara:strand:- start:234 stop:461 length:228 start_codon:yes stop_codon:yes gene_type:complete
MNNKNIFFKDIKSVASGFASTLMGMKSEIEALIRTRVDKTLNSKGFVSREDFHALEDRFDKLEAELKLFKKNKTK